MIGTAFNNDDAFGLIGTGSISRNALTATIRIGQTRVGDVLAAEVNLANADAKRLIPDVASHTNITNFGYGIPFETIFGNDFASLLV